MKNSIFDISINKENGAVTSITCLNDKHKMNWCIEDGMWGMPRCLNISDTWHKKEPFLPEMTAFSQDENTCSVTYKTDSLQINVLRFLTADGHFCERYTVKNIRDCDLFLEHGDFGITLPFNDIYTCAEDCLTNRCNTHIWCGGSTTYINALKMGESDINLGLVMTNGAAESYSVLNTKSNHRGIFVLNCEHIELEKNGEYVFQLETFIHSGYDDFLSKLREYPSFIEIDNKHFTVFENECIDFTIKSKQNNIKVFCDNKEIKTNEGRAVFKPDRPGKHRLDIYTGAFHTYTEFFVAEEIDKLIEKRINFIVDKQQYRNENSPLDGAFLIYDNKEKYPVFNSVIRDHNACRERMGMPLLICRYLQNKNNPKIRTALDRFVKFLMREFFDPQTGEVFDGIGRNKQYVRLYNAPWVTMFFTEMYFLTQDSSYLGYVEKLLEVYYRNGGVKFYPNGLSMQRTVSAFKKAGMNTEKIISMFKAHVDNMVSNGCLYPKHEVNFEQTIVSPAATFISEMAVITAEEKYKTEAEKHIKILKRFSGKQPSFHLNEIPIRYWDDFWFGKEHLFGDTFPHYWSCLTARAFTSYYNCSGNKEYLEAAEKCIRNCLCLFNENGEGSCAYVYPFRLNDKKGQFYDEWANDQDFALYFYLHIYEE